MDKVPFYAKVPEKVKTDFDVAVLKNKKADGLKREDVLEKLLKNYSKNGLPS